MVLEYGLRALAVVRAAGADGVRSADLAARLGVVPRTARKYVLSIIRAGFPVEYHRHRVRWTGPVPELLAAELLAAAEGGHPRKARRILEELLAALAAAPLP